MDSSRTDVTCKNSTYGCTFASSSEEDMVKHFQDECTFHPLQCFQCCKTVPKMNFAKHYEQCCKDSSASPCLPQEAAPDAAEATASAVAKCREEHFLRECVTDRAVCVKSLCIALKDVAADVAEVKVMKEKQQDLEAIVKGQGDVIEKLSTSISVVVEKVNKVQEDVSTLVNASKKDAETIVESVQNVDSLVKDCVKESRLGAERLSRVMRDVAADVAEVKLMRQGQNLEASVKQQGDLIKELEKVIMTNVEKVNEVEQGIGTIVQRVEKVDGLVKEVGVLTRRIGDQSKIHWYVENVSQYIEKAKTERSYVKSDAFLICGYSAKLWFEVEICETGPCMGLSLFLCRGHDDSLLRWPFRIPYTLSLIHPKDASKTKVYKVTPPSASPQCFGKPKNEENAGHGTRQLCTVEEAQNEGFIENDALCFALTLHE